MIPLDYRVRRVRRESRDTFTLDLEPDRAAVPLLYEPGQFSMLYAFGHGEVPISVSGDCRRPGTLTHTVRAVGPVTRALCALARGDWVGLRGPFGTAWPIERSEGADVVLLAGGLGLAPLRSALYEILARRLRFGTVVLLHGARAPQDLLFRRELERWRGRFDLQVHVTVDHARGDWLGPVGPVTDLIGRATFDPRTASVLLCGPEVMMRYAVRELERRGVPGESIHVSVERSMKCGVGACGHCQLGPRFVCLDGPVMPWTEAGPLLAPREL